MYCPECLVPYRDGFTECADCRVPLLAGEPPPDIEAPPNPDSELVTILEGNDPLVIAFARASLEEAGIPFHVLGDEVSVHILSLSPLIHPWCRIQVPRDREPEARAALQPLKEAGAPGDAAEEPDPGA